MSTSSGAARVVIKIGTSSLVTDGALSIAKADALAEVVVRLRGEGLRPVLVTSGAIALGRSVLPEAAQTLPSERQLAAAVGQGPLFESLRARLAARDLTAAQFLFTPYDLFDPVHRGSLTRALEQALDIGLVPVVNENDAVAVRNNDVLAALVSAALRARLLLLLTDVPGVFDTDPRRSPDARRIGVLPAMTTEVERLAADPTAGPGSGGMPAKLCAAWIATRAGVPAVIAAADEPDAALRAVRGEDVGTRIHAGPVEKEPDLRRLWWAFSEPSRGRLLCHASAERTVSDGGPLLLRQVRRAGGEVRVGSVVDLVTERSGVIARGRVSGAVPATLLSSGAGAPEQGDLETVLDQHSYISLMEVQ
ncbi:glutamate 5-kinase [Streptomyces europaeiscabiei]|uniref:glutamate 5-kinase n=1 Tax=Streptomyces europaeiscabiei TaxID=146819 RepID=UPI002E18162F